MIYDVLHQDHERLLMHSI